MTILIDTDALLGIFNSEDALHARATSVAAALLERGIETAILPTTLSEFARLASYMIGRQEAQNIISSLLNSGMQVLEMTEELTTQAALLYHKQTSKKETLFDCYIMAAATVHDMPVIFSFDEGYKKNGFQRAFELV